jgi:hypothetical protein
MSAMLRSGIVGFFVGFLAFGLYGLCMAFTPMDIREADRSAELEQMRRATFGRIEARNQVVHELIAERCTLPEAIAEYLQLDRHWPDYPTEIAKERADRSQEENAYRYIRVKVQVVLRDHPDQAALVLRRLEQEHEKLRTRTEPRP